MVILSAEHDRDVHAANNILGEGIHLLESRSKSTMASTLVSKNSLSLDRGVCQSKQ